MFNGKRRFNFLLGKFQVPSSSWITFQVLSRLASNNSTTPARLLVRRTCHVLRLPCSAPTWAVPRPPPPRSPPA